MFGLAEQPLEDGVMRVGSSRSSERQRRSRGEQGQVRGRPKTRPTRRLRRGLPLVHPAGQRAGPDPSRFAPRPPCCSGCLRRYGIARFFVFLVEGHKHLPPHPQNVEPVCRDTVLARTNAPRDLRNGGRPRHDEASRSARRLVPLSGSVTSRSRLRWAGRVGGSGERIDFTIERQRHARFVGREDVLARLDELLLGPGDAPTTACLSSTHDVPCLRHYPPCSNPFSPSTSLMSASKSYSRVRVLPGSSLSIQTSVFSGVASGCSLK